MKTQSPALTTRHVAFAPPAWAQTDKAWLRGHNICCCGRRSYRRVVIGEAVSDTTANPINIKPDLFPEPVRVPDVRLILTTWTHRCMDRRDPNPGDTEPKWNCRGSKACRINLIGVIVGGFTVLVVANVNAASKSAVLRPD